MRKNLQTVNPRGRAEQADGLLEMLDRVLGGFGGGGVGGQEVSGGGGGPSEEGADILPTEEVAQLCGGVGGAREGFVEAIVKLNS